MPVEQAAGVGHRVYPFCMHTTAPLKELVVQRANDWLGGIFKRAMCIAYRRDRETFSVRTDKPLAGMAATDIIRIAKGCASY